jgi:lipopolysaccharide export system permease protein
LYNFFEKLKLKTIDFYIIKKFIGTFVFSLIIIIGISVVFDYAEKVDDFMENNAPISEIIFVYYLNFIPYFANLFSYLFTFITVIMFTSRMAGNSEIIAILSTGISYRRLLYPYFVSATIIAIFSFFLSAYVIPIANAERLTFEYKYIISSPYINYEKNIHKQIRPGLFVYAQSYDGQSQVAQRFSLEKFEKGRLISKLNSNYAQWDSTLQKWHVYNYYVREIKGMTEHISKGSQIDTSAFVLPSDFSKGKHMRETMNIRELNTYIKEERTRGSGRLEIYEIEKYRRYSAPFATYILTLIGISLSSRKVRGGTGLHAGLGIFLSFTYILFFEVFTQAAIGGVLPSFLAVWVPNIIYLFIAIVLYKLAPK